MEAAWPVFRNLEKLAKLLFGTWPKIILIIGHAVCLSLAYAACVLGDVYVESGDYRPFSMSNINTNDAVLTLVGGLFISFVLLYLFCRSKIGPLVVLLSFILHTATLILLYAGIYRMYGFVSGVNENGVAIVTSGDFWGSLYFSIVTWTTLGYGDLSPVPDIQLLSAVQAILGYLYLGAIVSVLVSMFPKTR